MPSNKITTTRRRPHPPPSKPATAAPPDALPHRPRGDWLWLGAFLLLVFLAGCVEIEDGDIWWHLRTGQLIYQRGEVPRSDWFTYTNPDSPWIDLHWGFQLIAAGLWSLGGAPALVVAKAVLGTATFALALGCRRQGWPWTQAAVCWLAPLVIFAGRNQVRPEMFSFLFLAATLAVLFHQGTRRWLVWLLPVIQVLWINVHALYVLGLVVWGCFLLDALAGRLFSPGNERRASGADLGRWGCVTLAMLAAAGLNPYGLDGALFPLTLLRRIQGGEREFYQQFAGEFEGLGEFIGHYGFSAMLANVTTCLLPLLFVAGLASIVMIAWRGGRGLFRPLVFALFAFLAWQASRNSALFALAGGFVLAANVGELRRREQPADPRKLRLGRVVLASALGLLMVSMPTDVFWTLAHGEMPRRFGWGELPHAFAHRAAEFLGRKGMPARVFAVDQGAAAVAIFHIAPQRRVFADGRLEVNTRRTLERYEAIWGELTALDPKVIDHLLADVEPAADGSREVPALLVDLGAHVRDEQGRAVSTALALFADSRFRPVFFDGVACVFLATPQADHLGLAAVELTPQMRQLAWLRQNNRRIERPLP